MAREASRTALKSKTIVEASYVTSLFGAGLERRRRRGGFGLRIDHGLVRVVERVMQILLAIDAQLHEMARAFGVLGGVRAMAFR